MIHGIELTDHYGCRVIVNFAHVLQMSREKTDGTARFKAEDIGKDAVFILMAGPREALWAVTDPVQMDAVWSAFHEWANWTQTPIR